jgi:putative RNA 2'-phosphotransferase
MTAQQRLKQLEKIISYILGRNPAEFGLVPDPDGFVKIKEFLKVVQEENGLKHIRRSSVDEILITVPNPLIEIQGNQIRSTAFESSSVYQESRDVPKILFTCVRRKAYANVIEKGIFPMGFSHVILSSDSDMADKIGRRRDPEPVRLTVQTPKCMDEGIVFYNAGDTLYLAESIPSGCFAGPPLPKKKELPARISDFEEPPRDRIPGSFMLKIKDETGYGTILKKMNRPKSGSRETEFKKNKKNKRKRERPPWRQ